MSTSFTTCVISSLVFSVMTGPSAPAVLTASVTRLRPLSPALDLALVDGYRRSPTMRHLVAELDSSDVIVHIVPSHGQRGPAGAMHFVTRAGHHRFLRVTIDATITPNVRTAMLGHELQHALEVARSPFVVDQASFARLFRDIGFPGSGGSRFESYETAAAQDIAAQIMRESRGPRSAPSD